MFSGFDVAMRDLLLPGFVQGLPPPAGEYGTVVAASNVPLRNNSLLQILAVDVFLGDEMQPLDTAHFVDLHDVRVDQRRSSLRFVREPPHIGGGLGPIRCAATLKATRRWSDSWLAR